MLTLWAHRSALLDANNSTAYTSGAGKTSNLRHCFRFQSFQVTLSGF
jgi:hypothetical protein